MTREEYLKFHWKPYPAAPKDLLYSGRLISASIKFVGQKNLLLLTMEKNQQIQEYGVVDSSLVEVLKPGDLIAVDSSEKVHLLVPGEFPQVKVNIKTLQLWTKFLKTVRDYFSNQDFLEIQTPTLVLCPGTEPSLEVFSTCLKRGSSKQEMYLPTSPELHLKKALVMGFEKIYEIKSCFRNDEFTSQHQPEFTMIEWYRSYASLAAIRMDIQNLLSFIVDQFPQENLRWPQNFRAVTIAELFKEKTGFSIFPHSTLEDYQDIARQLGIHVHGDMSIDDYFFAIMMEKIEPAFPHEEVLFVYDYPPFQSALARLTPEGWADRMEVYFAGLELANGFHELNDPEEQERRFQLDLEKKTKMGKTEVNLDADFMALLKKGLPPSAGIALGLERLFMSLFKVEDIKSLRLFPY